MAKINQTGKIGFSRAIKDFFKGYFNFSGRTTRAGFWFVSLFLAIIIVPLVLLFEVTLTVLQSVPSLSGNPTLFNPFLYIILVLGIGVIFPVLALLARRMRDTGMKSYSIVLYLLLAVIVEVTGLLFQFQSNLTVNFSFFILNFFFLVAFFVFSLLPTNYFLGEETPDAEPDLQGWAVTKQGKVLKAEN